MMLELLTVQSCFVWVTGKKLQYNNTSLKVEKLADEIAQKRSGFTENEKTIA